MTSNMPPYWYRWNSRLEMFEVFRTRKDGTYSPVPLRRYVTERGARNCAGSKNSKYRIEAMLQARIEAAKAAGVSQ